MMEFEEEDLEVEEEARPSAPRVDEPRAWERLTQPRAQSERERPRDQARPAEQAFDPLPPVPPSPASAPPPSFLPGEELHGHVLRERIGVGGFGEVWRAENLDGESFALKFCRGLDPDSLASARREIALFERLRQGIRELPDGARRPPIVALKQSFLAAEPPAIVMEHVAGGDLRRFMRSRDFRPLSLAESLPLVGDLLDALAFAHERGVAHRDLSPENVLFDPGERRWKVADFGLGTALVETELSLARSGASSKLSTQVAGKLHYMAPEAQRGEAGPAADLYSLGVIWAQLLSGSLDAGLPATWTRRVPAEAVPILERCLEERPDDRWPSAAALRDAIARLAEDAGSAGVQFAGSSADSVAAAVPADQALANREELSSRPSAPPSPPRSGSGADLKPLGQLRLGRPFQLLVSADGRRALVGQWDGAIVYWDLARGVELSRHEPDRWGMGADSWNHKFLAISRDGSRAIFGSWEGALRVVDAADGRQISKTRADFHFEPVAMLSGDGGRVVAGNWSGKIAEYDAATGKLALGYGQGHKGKVTALAMSPAGDWIASGGADRVARVWRRGEGAWSREFERLPAAPSALAISPDAKRFLSGGKRGWFRSDTAVREWDLATGAPLRVLEGHSGTILQLAYSPDGRLALSGSADQTVRLWDLEEGREIACARVHAKAISAVGFGSDGRDAFTASKDGLVARWSVER